MRRLLIAAVLALACETAPSGTSPDAGTGSTVDRAPELVGTWSGLLSLFWVTDAGSSPYDSFQSGMQISSSGPNSITVSRMFELGQTTTAVRSDGSFVLSESTTVGGMFCPHAVGLQGAATLRDGGIEVSLSGPVDRESVFAECPDIIGASLSAAGRFERLPDLVVPRGLRVEELSEGMLALHWEPTHVAAEPWIDMNVDAGAWIGPSLFDIEDGYARVALSQYQPELSTLGFRIRLVRGAEQSDYADPVYWKRPISMPREILVYPYPPGQQVEWSGNSAKATQAILDRGLPDGPDGGIVWENIGTFPDLQGQVVVMGLLEGRDYWYRATYAAGPELSHPLVVDSRMPMPLASPRDLQAVVNGREVQLSWTNVTQHATEILLYRDTYLIGTLPPDAASDTDTAPGPGTFTYDLMARGGVGGSNSGMVSITVSVP